MIFRKLPNELSMKNSLTTQMAYRLRNQCMFGHRHTHFRAYLTKPEAVLLYPILSKDPDTEKEIEPPSGTLRYGLEASFVDGRPAPLSLIADSVRIDSNSGEIKLDGYKGDLRTDKQYNLRLRVVMHRVFTDDENDGKLKQQRIASPYFYALTLDEEGNPLGGNLMFLLS